MSGSPKRIPMNPQARSLFRRIWRAAPEATYHSKPAFWTIRRNLKDAYRDNGPLESLGYKELLLRGENTLKVIESAKRKGPEHKLIANVCSISREKWYTDRSPKPKSIKGGTQIILQDTFQEYNDMIHLLNESMRVSFR